LSAAICRYQKLTAAFAPLLLPHQLELSVSVGIVVSFLTLIPVHRLSPASRSLWPSTRSPT